MTFIETARLALRKMMLDDADNLLGIFQNPVAMRYYRNSKDRAETLDWIDWNLHGYREDGIGLWIVELRDSGQFVGQCGLTMQEVEGVREPEVGYLFLQEAWGERLRHRSRRRLSRLRLHAAGLSTDHLPPCGR